MSKKQILALGFFDGVHLGHQALLRACRDLATEYGCGAGAVTFSSHPEALVKGSAPTLLTTLEDRQRLLLDFGMEQVIVLPFDRALMTMPWQDFLSMLVDKYHAAGLVCGDDFHFGHRGEGTAQRLKQQCTSWGIPCAVVPEQTVQDVRVSSSHIRALMEQGRMAEAVRFLGHPHILTGTVVSGHQLGRRLGIPTANLAVPDGVLVPKFGVYVCAVRIDGRHYTAVANVGTRPTVGGHHVTVEPWILNFEGDLYGREITLEFYSFLRPERKFGSLEELQAEIQKNAADARKFFEKS